MSITLILGAGFSFTGGLPLTKDLFTELPRYKESKNRADEQRMVAVQQAFESWCANNEGGAEIWLREMHGRAANIVQASGISWDDIVQYVCRRVSRAKNADAGPYYYGITRHDIPSGHRQFWQRMEELATPFSVVTLNYDILVERALNRLSADGKKRPRFYYGGLPYGMQVNKMIKLSNPKQSIEVPLGNEVGIFKLHGSLNWAREPHSPLLKIHDDVRAAYRQVGTPQIIPPIAEKEMSLEFGAIWAEAEVAMAKSDTWIVFGYSLPKYDLAVSNLITRSAASGQPKKLSVIDPDSTVMDRWAALPNCLESIRFSSVDDWISSTENLSI